MTKNPNDKFMPKLDNLRFLNFALSSFWNFTACLREHSLGKLALGNGCKSSSESSSKEKVNEPQMH